MRQLLKISLLVFYVLFNAGMSYSMHFCGEDFKRINLFAESKTCCPSKEPMPGCCDDVSNLELPNTDQQLSDLLDFQPLTLEVVCPRKSPYSLPELKFARDIALGFTDSSPPLFETAPLFLLHCIFLI